MVSKEQREQTLISPEIWYSKRKRTHNGFCWTKGV